MIPIVWVAAPLLLVTALALGRESPKPPEAAPEPLPPEPEPNYGTVIEFAPPVTPRRRRKPRPALLGPTTLPSARAADEFFAKLKIAATPSPSRMDLFEDEPRGRVANVLQLPLDEATEAARLRFKKGPVLRVTPGRAEILVEVDPASTGLLAVPPSYLGWPIRIVERR